MLNKAAEKETNPKFNLTIYHSIVNSDITNTNTIFPAGEKIEHDYLFKKPINKIV